VSLVKTIDLEASLACTAQESSASPGTIRVLEANGERSRASLSDGARSPYAVGPRYVGIGHVVVG
jgi:hypothetical protein